MARHNGGLGRKKEAALVSLLSQRLLYIFKKAYRETRWCRSSLKSDSPCSRRQFCTRPNGYTGVIAPPGIASGSPTQRKFCMPSVPF